MGAVIMTVLAAIALGGLTARDAAADAFGEVASYGSAGTGPGQLYAPGELAVDPGASAATDADDSVYVLDAAADRTSFRLQKLVRTGSTLTPVAAVTIPAPADGSGHRPTFLGIVVDAALHRVYLLQFRQAADPTSGRTAAEQIRVFSTDAQGGALVAPSDLPSGTLPVPAPNSASAIDDPSGFALDPTDHDLLVLGYSSTANQADRVIVIQRIGSDGTAGARYVDDPNTSAFGGREYFYANGLVVAPDGSVYVGKGSPGFDRIYLYRLPGSFASVTTVLQPSSTVATSESWMSFAPDIPGSGGEGDGPQLALSADGSTIYWTEVLAGGNDITPGSYQVRGFDLQTGATRVVYGNGATTCQVTAAGPGLAASGNDFVYVLDHGNFFLDPPTYGGAVLEFGPGGTGCPIPDPRFTVNGSTDSSVSVQKGSTVQFLADTSHLNGATATELDWDLDGSGAYATVVGGPSPDPATTHKYLQTGVYSVSLRMQLTGGTVDDLPPVSKTVTVVAGTPTAAFSASTTSPAAGATVTFDASSSVDPTGSASAGPTSRLRTYSWDFGDGTTQTTSAPTVEHAFANAGATAVDRTVRLTVTSFDGVDSAPASQTVAVQGTPVVTPPVTTPVTTPIVTPPPVIPGPGKASLVAAALKGTSAALTLRCAAKPGACGGTLTLVASILVKPKHGKARARATVVGSARFSLAAGARRGVTVKLSKAARTLLARSHRLKLTVRIVTRNQAGKQATASKRVTLVVPARRGRRRG